MGVGVPALDADHRCLIRIVNLLQGIDDDETPTLLETVLDSLLLYGQFHFRREERVLAAIDFPAAVLHGSEHDDFTAAVERLRARCAKPVESGFASRVFGELAAWLRHHILIQDMAFKPHIADVTYADALARADATACLLVGNVDRRRHSTPESRSHAVAKRTAPVMTICP